MRDVRNDWLIDLFICDGAWFNRHIVLRQQDGNELINENIDDDYDNDDNDDDLCLDK